MSADDLASRLRRGPLPVVARIEDDRVVLDLRTVRPDEDLQLAEALAAVSPSSDAPTAMSAATTRQRAGAAEWLAVAAILALTAVAADLRLPGLEQPGLWLDEIVGVFRAQTSPFTTSWSWGTDPSTAPCSTGSSGS